MSIRNLASKKKGVASARFWGKILGLQNDYYIAELEFPGKDSVNRNDPYAVLSDDYVEPRGVGANKYVYFCCTSVPGEWVQLPNAVPAQIKASREINKLFTGDLSAPVWSHPPFPWTEKELLRSMIARISHSTILAPVDYYEVQEGEGEGADGDVVRKAWNGFAGKETGAVPKDPAQWVHARAYLRLNGRISAAKLPEDEDGAGGMSQEELDLIRAKLEKENNEEGDVSANPAQLFGLVDEMSFCRDNKYQEPWLLVTSGEEGESFKVCGDQSVYGFPDPIGSKCYAVTCIESLRFPGAYTVAQGDTFCNIYIGYGVKKQRAFMPLKEMAPGPIMDEPVDAKEEIQDDAQEEEIMDDGGDPDEDAEPDE